MTTFMKSRLRQAVAPRGRFARAIVAAVSVGLFSTACDVHGLSGPGTLATLEITPNPQTLAINATQQFTVVGKDFAGVVVPVSPAWTATAGGAINASGMFTAGTVPGTFANSITASSNGKSATATVIVTAGPLATITLTPTPITLAIGATQQYVAVGKDAAGNVVAFTPTWSVIAGGGSINSSGLFTAGTVSGTYTNTVQVNSGTIRATGTVTVTPGPLATLVVTPNPVTLNANATQQFSVVGKDANGNTVAFTPVWSVAAGGGTINATTGLFTAGTTGGTFANTVVATVGAISGTATVTVIALPLATITVTPSQVTLAPGATQQYTAVGMDAVGNIVAITPAWSASAGGTIDFTTGLFTAGNTPGAYTNNVRASVGGISGFASVTVTQGPATTITLTPNQVTLQTGGTQQYSATARDAGGNVVSSSATFTVINGGGTITAGGLFTAGINAGSFPNTVQAQIGGLTATASVTVTPVLAAIAVTPQGAVIAPNATQQYSATGVDQQGNAFGISPVWSVNGGGTINAITGLFTSNGTPGNFIITATSGAISGTATITVTPPAPVLTTIVVTPAAAVILPGATQQFSARGLDANGATFAISPVWTVSGGGTINVNTGLFTSNGTPGTFTVTATSGAKSGTATVTVTAAPPVLTTIVVTPATAIILPGATQQFSARGLDAGGNTFAISPIWSVALGAGGVNGGSINANTGLFTSNGNAGTFTVTATSGAVSGTGTVTVSAAVPVLTTITLSPNPAILNTGGTQQFTAVGRDQNGNVFVIPPGAVYAATLASGTITTPGGLFTAGATAGTYTDAVTLTSGAIVGKATVIESAPPPAPLFDYLRSTAANGIMAGTAVSCAGAATIQGNYAISPGVTAADPELFSGPCVVSGTAQSKANSAAQQLDLTLAYNDLFNQVRNPCPANHTYAAPGQLASATPLLPGVYCSGSSLQITGNLTLDGNNDPNAVFVFQAGSSLTTAGNVLLINGAKAQNVYFVIGSTATLGTASQFQGNIVALTSINTVTGATINGRALARQGAVSLGVGSVITLP
jgi:hypothetical protein